MAKERYIKINNDYYPIEGSRWRVLEDGNVYFAEVGNTDNFEAVAYGEDAFNLVALLDEMSLPIELLREQANG